MEVAVRPKDSNQLAKQIVDISTGQMPDPVRRLPLKQTAARPTPHARKDGMARKARQGEAQ